MPSEAVIRRMTDADVDAVAAVEAATFPTPWSRDAFASEMRNAAARYLVAEVGGRVVGFAGAWIILDESHVTNIAVLKDHRGQGLGRALTAGLMQYLSNLGAAYVTLEVRRSNIIAQTLYESLGFIRLGVRKRYYEDNGEDALIMVCDHMPPADPDFEEAETVTE
ncbi:MAG: ribosomal protein S18-alanine N-acetyltransferase [Christensenellaceae bacterium]|nr:ribosomal protein S18-alanine N-acetyltransferase [Christensenellaceae bacterium]